MDKSCFCGASPAVRVVSGNDLTVEALLSLYDRDSGVYKPLDLSEASDVSLRLVGTFSKVQGKDAAVAGSKVSALFPAGSLGVGVYGVEVTFKDSEGNGRAFERNLIGIVATSGEATTESSAEGDTGEGLNITVDVKTRTVRIGGSGSGVTDYTLLENKPKINEVTLDGNKTPEDLGLMPEGGAYTKEEADGKFETKEKAASDLKAVTEAIGGKVDKVAGKGLSKNDYTDEDKKKVHTALQTESDPTVPDWAKAAAKPTYTAREVGALPDTTKIPTKVSELENDSGYLTEHQSLEAYYQKAAAQLDNRVVAEALVSLAARLDALEGSRGLLGDATAGTLDVRGLTRCRYPLVMLGHGVPAEANVPDNLPAGLPWDGVPAFEGQQYVNLDAASGGLYYAVGVDTVADWKQA